MRSAILLYSPHTYQIAERILSNFHTIFFPTPNSDFLFVPSHRVTAKVNKINNIVSHGKMDEAVGLEFALGEPRLRITLSCKARANVLNPPFLPPNFSLTLQDADYRGVFSWNVKQLFIYVTVDYTTPLNGRNEVVIWDQIMEEHNDKIIKQRRIKPEYRLVDQARGLKGNQYNLTVHWNVMPWVGMLTTKKETFGPFEFPGGGAKESAESS